MSSAGHLSELDLLRGQVADLSRQLAERDRSMQDLREQSQLLRTIVEGTASETGDEFFTSLVTHLTSTLHVQYAVVSEVLEAPFRKIRTLAVSAGDTLIDNFEYDLDHTPCATALTQAFACFTRDLRATFPEFPRLVDLGAESYCAVPVRTKDGAVRGLLVVMDTKPLQHGGDLQSLLEVFAPRVGAEFERRRVEQGRARALAEIRNVIETVPDIMFTLDTHGNIVKWNRRVEDVTGYSPEELLNMPALAFVPPEEHVKTATAIERAFTEGYAELEGHLLTKEYRTIPYHWTGALLKNSHGQPIGITGVGRDVSAKRRAEEERQKALIMLTNVINNTPDLIFVKDRDLRTVLCNNAFAQAAGKLPEDLLGHTDVENGWDPELVYGNLEKGIRGFEIDDREALSGKAMRIPSEPVNVGSEVRMFDTHKVPLRSDTGEVIGVLGIARDITERKRTEEALRASEERWQLAVRGTNDGIWDWDIQTDEIHFSPRWKAMRGFEDYEIANHVEEWRSRIHPDDLDRVLRNIGAYLAKERPEFCEEYRVQKKDGSYIWIVDRGIALWNEGGTPTRMVGSEADITERKQAQEKRYESEAQLLAILDNSPSLIFLKDLDGRYLRVNRVFEESFRLTNEEIIGKTDRDIFPPEQAVVFQSNDEKVLRGGMPMLFEEAAVYGNSPRVSIVHKFPLRNKERTLYAIGGVATDITDRKRAEESLLQSWLFLQSFVEHTPAAVAMFDRDLKYVAVSKRWYEDYQLGDRNIIGLHHYDVFPEIKKMEHWQAIHRRCLAGEILHSNEDCLVREDGKENWLRWEIRPWTDPSGSIGGIIMFTEVITGRKQAEEALRASEERFDLAVRGSNTGIWDWDLRTNKTYFSPLWKSMLGYGEHELKGEFFEWEERLHPDDRERSSATVRAYLDGTTPQYELEHRLRHKDGSYRWILARGVSICDTAGQPYRMAGSHIDITELKQTQEALAQRERQLQTVLDALPVGVWFTDQAGRLLLANPAARQIWSGVRQVGVETGANAAGWWEATGPSGELHRWALSQALTKGIPSPHETLDLECLDGTKKTIRNWTVPVRGEAGVVVGALVLNEDITSLRQAQEAIRLTQFSVDHAVEAFFWIDHQGNILNVNESACRMLEHSRERLITMTVHDIDPNFPPELWPTHWAELKEKGSITFESKLWSHQGHVIDTEVTVNYLHYDGHEYNCAIMRDIGERRRAEDALRKSETRLRTITDAVPGAVYQYQLSADGTQQFLFMSQGIQALVGVTSAEGENDFSSIWNRVLPEEVGDLWASIRESSETLSPWKHEFRILHADGTTRWIRGNSIPESPRDDGSILWNGILIDITDRKRMEETLRQRERDLRAAIEERERISQDLHDGILQSLFAVGLTLETTKLMLSSRKRKTSVPALDQAIKQLNLVMGEIRNFIAGLGSDLLQWNDLPAALQHMLASMMQNQATRVRLAVEDRAAKALSAEQSLHLVRVIQEAVSNCIKHGRASEARVSLKMLKQGVRLSIRDNGRGFNQDAAKGTGHGLRNMAARAQKLGGRFTVLSKVKEGTRIVLDLPKEVSDVSR